MCKSPYFDIEFEKAPIDLAPDDYNGTFKSNIFVELDHVYLGHFENNAIGKMFHILLYNCYLRDDGEEAVRTYRIWSENQSNTTQHS